MSTGLQSMINYMIPAVGTPRGYVYNQALVAGTPQTIDFRGITGGGIDGQPFRPSGVYMDNSQGTAPLKVTINEISFSMICPIGEALNLPYPAPIDMTATVSGEGTVTIVFVDTPVMPYRSF